MDTSSLIKKDNHYQHPNLEISASQRQTAQLFGYIWKNNQPYQDGESSGLETDKQVMAKLSEGRFEKALNAFFADFSPKKPCRLLDAGCGVGYGFKMTFTEYIDRIEYIGIDVHPNLDETYQYLSRLTSPNGNTLEKPTLIQCSMNDLPDCIRDVDLIWAHGSMHHSDSVGSAVANLSARLSKNGLFLFWIIGEQKPLRKKTDEFFRDQAMTFSDPDQFYNELIGYSKLTMALGSALEEKAIDIEHPIKMLGIEPGRYKLQTLLYDYFVKCYYKPGLSLERHVHQHLDWFFPTFYHQTGREDLEKILDKSGFSQYDIVEKTNGFAVVARN